MPARLHPLRGRLPSRGRLHRARSLRSRLLVLLVTLLALVCLGVGATTLVALDHYLVDRVDVQLQLAKGRSQAANDRPGGQGQTPPPGSPEADDDDDGTRSQELQFLGAPGQGTGTFGARIVAGKVIRAGVLDTNRSGPAASVQTVTSVSSALLVAIPIDGEPHTRDLGTLGDYRLIAVRSPDGAVLVTGLPLSGVHSTVLRLAAIETAVALVALLIAILVGAAIVRRDLRPLNRMAATAGRVANLRLDRGEVALAERIPDDDADPRTEVGQVGQALNAMLSHVAAALEARQSSEMRVRQFVADASHELRTPLAAIRGYAELTRRSSSHAPPDIVHALGRVESEAQRMTTLVEDLLLLARLDAGRPLAFEAVDLVPLVVNAISDAHATGPGHVWQLDLPEEPVPVPGDPARLHQVVANLLANARTHTPAGTAVSVRIRAEGGSGGGAAADESRAAVLTIEDNGPGIPADLLPHVFERFARGDESRSRTAGSTGLGLAIVHAVVVAHAGRVLVDSRPGRTAFTVRLPLADEPAVATAAASA